MELSGTCPDTYDDVKSSYITSSNYPKFDGYKVDCRWTITILDESSVLLKFVDFDITGRRHALYIYNGTDDSAKTLNKFISMTSNPSEVWLSGKTAHLFLSGDGYATGKGIKILLKTYGK